MTKLVYRIDEQDRIVAVGDDWQGFARANEGTRLLSESVVGRKLLDFVSEGKVREIYAAIIARARGGRPVRFVFRCDAPAWRREFAMEVRASSPTVVEFVSTLLAETPRPPIHLFGSSSPAPKKYVRLCSWCHAIADDAGKWRPLEIAIATLPVLEDERDTAVTHGICPACAQAMFGILQG